VDFTKIHGPHTMTMGFLVSCSGGMVAGCCQEHFVETRRVGLFRRLLSQWIGWPRDDGYIATHAHVFRCADLALAT